MFTPRPRYQSSSNGRAVNTVRTHAFIFQTREPCQAQSWGGTNQYTGTPARCARLARAKWNPG